MRVEKFKANFGSPARPTLFRVYLDFPGTGKEEKDVFFCKGAQIPSRNTGKIELSYFGRKIQYAGDTTYDDWTVTIYNDVDFTIRKKLEAWAELINGAKDNRSKFRPEDYKRDLRVDHVDGEDNIIKTYTFVGAFLQTTGDPIDLSWENSDQQEEYSVNFAYDYWYDPKINRE